MPLLTAKVPVPGHPIVPMTLVAEDQWGELWRGTHAQHGRVLVALYAGVAADGLLLASAGEHEKWVTLAAGPGAGLAEVLEVVADSAIPFAILRDPGGATLREYIRAQGAQFGAIDQLRWALQVARALDRLAQAAIAPVILSPDLLFHQPGAPDNPWVLAPLAPGQAAMIDLVEEGKYAPRGASQNPDVAASNGEVYGLARLWAEGMQQDFDESLSVVLLSGVDQQLRRVIKDCLLPVRRGVFRAPAEIVALLEEALARANPPAALPTEAEQPIPTPRHTNDPARRQFGRGKPPEPARPPEPEAPPPPAPEDMPGTGQIDLAAIETTRLARERLLAAQAQASPPPAPQDPATELLSDDARPTVDDVPTHLVPDPAVPPEEPSINDVATRSPALEEPPPPPAKPTRLKLPVVKVRPATPAPPPPEPPPPADVTPPEERTGTAELDREALRALFVEPADLPRPTPVPPPLIDNEATNLPLPGTVLHRPEAIDLEAPTFLPGDGADTLDPTNPRFYTRPAAMPEGTHELDRDVVLAGREQAVDVAHDADHAPTAEVEADAIDAARATPPAAAKQAAPAPLEIPGYEVLEVYEAGPLVGLVRARQTALGREVLLRPAIEPENWKYYSPRTVLRQARPFTRLNHPNVLPCLDTPEHNGMVYLVMERLEGITLEELLDADGFGALDAGLRRRFLRGPGVLSREGFQLVAESLAAALEHAHATGVVHRALKPSRVAIGPDGTVRLFDFGVPRVARPEDGTENGVIYGSPAYMAPEALQNGEIDGRTDLYSMGCLLFRAVAGRVPFAGPGELLICIQQVRTPPPNPLAEVKGWPAEVGELILACLGKQPLQRPQSAGDVLARLRRLPGATPQTREPLKPPPVEDTASLPGEAIRTLHRPDLEDTHPPTPAATMPAVDTAPPTAPRAGIPRWARVAMLLAGLVGLALLLVVGAIIYVYTMQPELSEAIGLTLWVDLLRQLAGALVD